MSILSEYPANVPYPNWKGHASIQFRNEPHNSTTSPQANTTYTLNTHGDGWFRVKDKTSIADSYGLMVRNLRITGRTKIESNNGYYVKAVMTYITNEDEIDIAPVWLYIGEKTCKAEILQYIQANKGNWKP